MLPSEDPYKRIVDTWNLFYPQKPQPEELQKFLQESRVLDEVYQSNLKTVIFSYNDFRIHHINVGAARYFGATPDEIMSTGATWLLNCIDSQQRNKALANIGSIATIMMAAPPDAIRSSFSCYMNLHITCPASNSHRALFQIFPVMISATGQPLIGMLVIHEVGAFMADQVWWCRYKVGQEVRVYHPEPNQLESADILSQRELEILQLVAAGKSTKDIASELFLSSNTVDNHRRNMLRKTGAKDTSALIHLAKLCHLM